MLIKNDFLILSVLTFLVKYSIIKKMQELFMKMNHLKKEVLMKSIYSKFSLIELLIKITCQIYLYAVY